MSTTRTKGGDTGPLAEWWTAQQCADFLNVKVNTWHAYVHRPGKKNPAPRPAIKVANVPLWDPAAVREYARNRYRAVNS